MRSETYMTGPLQAKPLPDRASSHGPIGTANPLSVSHYIWRWTGNMEKISLQNGCSQVCGEMNTKPARSDRQEAHTTGAKQILFLEGEPCKKLHSRYLSDPQWDRLR